MNDQEPYWMRLYKEIGTFISYAKINTLLLLIAILLLMFIGYKVQYWISLVRLTC